MHDDNLSGYGIYSVAIPGKPVGTWVRFYIKATSGNQAKSVSYDPPGAEHDICILLVEPILASDTSMRMNELMAKNNSTVSDNAGDFDDWIELYNNSSISTNISGYFLTNDPLNLIKWEVPSGTAPH